MTTEINKSSTFAKLKVPIGPSHPALEEPARFVFDVEGEKVVDVDYEIGYNHRSIERLCQERPMPKIVYLVNASAASVHTPTR